MAADLHSVVDSCLDELEVLSKYLKKSDQLQIWNADEKSVAKATALTWFNTHRKALSTAIPGSPNLPHIDTQFKALLAYTDKSTTRSKYLVAIKTAQGGLRKVRQDIVSSSLTATTSHHDAVPDFSKLVSDAKMRQILENRWRECQKCIAAEAALAATVMMGGLLEALFLAKINSLTDKAPVFKTTKAPKDKSTGKPLQLKDWGLKDYIDVSHELTWITVSAKGVSEVIRDYRNYVHPNKELSHNIDISQDDAKLFWEICKQLARQILK